jgi:hypothetical protein
LLPQRLSLGKHLSFLPEKLNTCHPSEVLPVSPSPTPFL